MILNQSTFDVQTSGVTNTSNFTVRADAKAFEILSSNLYSDTVKAIVRELSCNAYDSHVEANKSDCPFTVHLPTSLDPTFYVEDDGVGLSKEQIIGYVDDNGEFHSGLYQTLFDSSKTNSNDVIGALGLGSKTPFSYTSSFSVQSRYNGTLMDFVAYKDKTGMPTISLLSETPTTKCNGVKVSFAVKESDATKFHAAAQTTLCFFSTLPNILGMRDNYPIEYIHYDISGSNWGFKHDPRGYRSGMIYIVQGFVAYPLQSNMLDTSLLNSNAIAFKDGFITSSTSLYITVPIGTVEPAPSREALTYNQRTIENICTTLNTVADDILSMMQLNISSQPTEWLARIEYNNYHKLGIIPYTIIRALKWKNTKTNTEVLLCKDRVVNDISLNYPHIKMRRISRNRTSFRQHDSITVFNESCDTLRFVVCDTDKPYNDVLLQYQRSLPAKLSVVVLQPVDTHEMIPAELGKFLDDLGNPPVEHYKNLNFKHKPTPSSSNHSKREEMSQLMRWTGQTTYDGGISQCSWQWADVDPAPQYLYVWRNKYDITTDAGDEMKGRRYCSYFYSIVNDAIELGIISKDVPIYGLTPTSYKQLKKSNNGKLINLFDLITSTVKNKMTDPEYIEYEQSVKLSESLYNYWTANSYNKLSNTLMYATDVKQHLLPSYTNLLDKICKLIKIGRTKKYERIDHVRRVLEIELPVCIAHENAKLVESVKELTSNLCTQYPLLPHLQSIINDSDPSDATVTNAIIDYIKKCNDTIQSNQ